MIYFIYVYLIDLLTIIVVIYTIRYKKRNIQKLIRAIIGIILVFYSVGNHHRMYEFSRYDEIIRLNLGRSAITNWNGYNKKLRFPRNIEELNSSEDSFTHYYNYQFGLVSEQVDNYKYHFKVYTFGFDDDDDQCKKIYDVSVKNVLNPFIDGDVILYEGTLCDTFLFIFYPDKKCGKLFKYNRFSIPDSLIQKLRSFD